MILKSIWLDEQDKKCSLGTTKIKVTVFTAYVKNEWMKERENRRKDIRSLYRAVIQNPEGNVTLASIRMIDQPHLYLLEG
jgi:hypothetical protein